MKNFRFLNTVIIALIAGFVFVSCSSDEEPLPANVIEDTEGLIIDLEWNTGGGAQQSISDVDLDYYIKDTDGQDIIVARSTSSFESQTLPDIYADGTYLVDVLMYGGNKSSDFTLIARGVNGSKTVTFEGSFSSTDEGERKEEFISITKRGDSYTIAN